MSRHRLCFLAQVRTEYSQQCGLIEYADIYFPLLNDMVTWKRIPSLDELSDCRSTRSFNRTDTLLDGYNYNWFDESRGLAC